MEHYENQSNSNLDLAQFDDAFETAEVEEREFEAVPDGKYQVNVDRVELTRAQTSGSGAVLDLKISPEALTPRQTLSQMRNAALKAKETL